MSICPSTPRDRAHGRNRKGRRSRGGKEEREREDWANEDRVGVFSTLTNSYALVAVGASENFYRYVLLALFLVLAGACEVVGGDRGRGEEGRRGADQG